MTPKTRKRRFAEKLARWRKWNGRVIHHDTPLAGFYYEARHVTMVFADGRKYRMTNAAIDEILGPVDPEPWITPIDILAYPKDFPATGAKT